MNTRTDSAARLFRSTTFLRGTEWAATGKVTQDIPADFPGADKTSARTFLVKPAP